MGEKAHKIKDGYFVFECPGCECLHSIQTPQWTFNGDLEKPTVSPSILVNPNGDSSAIRCHSFVRDGMIQFLDDCEHSFKGQTVEIPDWTSLSEVINKDKSFN